MLWFPFSHCKRGHNNPIILFKYQLEECESARGKKVVMSIVISVRALQLPPPKKKSRTNNKKDDIKKKPSGFSKLRRLS